MWWNNVFLLLKQPLKFGQGRVIIKTEYLILFGLDVYFFSFKYLLSSKFVRGYLKILESTGFQLKEEKVCISILFNWNIIPSNYLYTVTHIKWDYP